MDMITVTAKTVDEAVTKALIELETTSDKLEYEVVDKGGHYVEVADALIQFGGQFGKAQLVHLHQQLEAVARAATVTEPGALAVLVVKAEAVFPAADRAWPVPPPRWQVAAIALQRWPPGSAEVAQHSVDR